eukprot:jgi/Mesen1/3598/ME000020S03134
MGALCCCPRPDDFDDIAVGHPGGSAHQDCFCLRCCMRWCLRTYTSLFEPAEARDAQSSAMQGASSSASASLLVPIAGVGVDTSSPDTYRAPPRPLPYDVDPRYSFSRGVLSRREKSPLRQTAGTERHASSGVEEAMAPLQRRAHGAGGSSASSSAEAGDTVPPLAPPPPPLSMPPISRPISPGPQQLDIDVDGKNKLGLTRVESALSLADDDCCPTCLD